MECNIIEQEGLIGTLENFVGKKKELLAGEKALDGIVKYINDLPVHLFDGNKSKSDKTLSKLNRLNHNVELEKQIKKLFRFKSLRIMWMNTPIANAGAYPNSYAYFDRGYKVDEHGIDYNDKLHPVIIMNVGLITSAKLNVGEVMSVLLHEVGHIFDTSLSYTVSLLTEGIFINMVTYAVRGAIYYHGVHNNFFDLVEDIKEKNPVLIDRINNLKNTVGLLLSMVSEYTIIKLLLKHPLIIWNIIPRIIKDIDPIKSLMRYNMEKNADQFAIDYGYGVESVSASFKMKKVSGPIVTKRIPGLNWYYDMNMLPLESLNHYISGYPSDLNRTKTSIDVYERYLDDPKVPEEAKKQIHRSLLGMREIYALELSIKNDENKQAVFTWVSKNLASTLFDGKADIRELSRIKPFKSRK